MFTDEELGKFGFKAYHIGDPVDGALLQADHPEYAELTPADLPGIKVFVDGRHVVDPAAWGDVEVIVVGDGEA
ncbi:UDP-N-acetyl-D-mannosaminuronic acid dehydrogenase [Cutibacterium acnes JCM 18909]|nr:UDP-N-acetyl-D-mannosaminuronic acid dehydrogenase [Cutibacterium acnes JCM 18909]